MSLIVKICGLSNEEMLDVALEAGADMVGFVFFARSPRYVAVEAGRRLAARARGRAEVVALTVDMEAGALAELVDHVRPDWLQFHGSETPEAIAAMRRRLSVRVMKALPIAVAADLDRTTAYMPVVDRLLLDAKPPKDADRPGGHGRPFDWTVLTGFHPPKPYLLSGGLTPDNVVGAIRISGAPGVDVSSGVESAPGRKDPALIRAFVAAARQAAAAPSVPERVA